MAALLGMLVLGEPITAGIVLGFLLIVVGCALSTGALRASVPASRRAAAPFSNPWEARTRVRSRGPTATAWRPIVTVSVNETPLSRAPTRKLNVDLSIPIAGRAASSWRLPGG